jgi:hypothetical protein
MWSSLRDPRDRRKDLSAQGLDVPAEGELLALAVHDVHLLAAVIVVTGVGVPSEDILQVPSEDILQVPLGRSPVATSPSSTLSLPGLRRGGEPSLEDCSRRSLTRFASLMISRHSEALWRLLGYTGCRRFEPGGSLDRRVNYRRVPQPRWVGARRSAKGGRSRRETGVRGEIPRPSCLSRAQVGCACSRGLQASTREGGSGLTRAPSCPSPRGQPSYEGPGSSFYRRKERIQVYNGV